MKNHSTHILVPMLRKLSLWTDLSTDDQAAIVGLPYTRKSLAGGSYIVRDGDKPTHSCVLLEGFAFRHKVVGDGRRQILAVHIAGDIVDLQNSLLRIADHNVQTLTRVEVAFIPREAVEELAFTRPAVGMAMWYDTLVDGSLQREWTTRNGRLDAKARVAHFLCEFGLRMEAVALGRTDTYELPMTQEQIADATGLTAVHVNRTLMALDKEGLTRRTKRSIMIDDWNRLAAVGDFNPAYLHLPSGSE